MLRFIFTRLSLIIPTFFGMTLLAFFLIRMVPGDPIETLAGERGIERGIDRQRFAGRFPIGRGKALDLGEGRGGEEWRLQRGSGRVSHSG